MPPSICFYKCINLRHMPSSKNSTFFNNLLPTQQTSRTTSSLLLAPPESSILKTTTTTILNHVRLGRLSKAISILFSTPFSLPFPIYTHLFQICSTSKSIIEVRKLESHLVSFNPTPPVFLLNRAIQAYGKCGYVVDARELFDEMPQRDGGSWNAIITAYSLNGFCEEVFGVFLDMRRCGIFASEVTFAGVLGSCGSVRELWLSRQVHGLVLKYGFCGNVILESSIVDVYGKCGVMSEARRMFDGIKNPNNISWNMIIRRYLDLGKNEVSVSMFFKMIGMSMRPLNFTVSSAIVACSRFRGIEEGMQIHGYVIKTNMVADDVVCSSLIDMFVKCEDMSSAQSIFDLPSSKNLINYTSMVSGYAMSGRFKKAKELFDEMAERNVISWNAMLAGYTRHSQWDDALNFFIMMNNEFGYIDHLSLVLILNVCAALSDVQLGKQVHGYIYRHRLNSNSFVGNALLDMYGKCGSMKSARVWFNEMRHSWDSVSWNSLLTSYASHKLSEEALIIFPNMLGDTTPSKYTFATLLATCANIFALEQGKEIHGFLVRNGYDVDIVLKGALVDMYFKCRHAEYGLKVFSLDNIRADVILWNSVMFGCYYNGIGEKVFEFFDLMEKEGVNPDYVTLHALLLACISKGRVNFGSQLFDSMIAKYCIIPRLEHYESMIELYARHGFMDKLEDFVKSIPFDLTVPMLSKVFYACKKSRSHLKLGEWAAEQIAKVDPNVSLTSDNYNSR